MRLSGNQVQKSLTSATSVCCRRKTRPHVLGCTWYGVKRASQPFERTFDPVPDALYMISTSVRLLQRQRKSMAIAPYCPPYCMTLLSLGHIFWILRERGFSNHPAAHMDSASQKYLTCFPLTIPSSCIGLISIDGSG